MYSVVLMAALTAGTSTPACHWGKGGCHGCNGYYGCYGGCYGYNGGASWGACGCYAGYNACYGGCWGSCYGCHGCYGCYGCHGCAGGWAPGPIEPVAPVAPAEIVPSPRPKEGASSATQAARLIVEVPADAKLYVDDHLMKTTAARRQFNTPRLDRGQAYYYILRAEVVRDGEKRVESKRVVLRAGEEIHASFNDLDAATTVRKDAEILTTVKNEE